MELGVAEALTERETDCEVESVRLKEWVAEAENEAVAVVVLDNVALVVRLNEKVWLSDCETDSD